MTDTHDDREKVILLEPAVAALRDEFLGWQCRIRQLAVRQFGGRPSSGMRPRVLDPQGDEIAPAITVLINPEEPENSIKLFRHQVLKTNDPIERYDKALEILAASYFQQPAEFSDVLTALFGPGSSVAGRLLDLGQCVLEFEQFSQTYRLPCTVLALGEDEPFYKATYWHNRLYNPAMPPGISILAFTPDWTRAGAFRRDD